MPMPLATLNVPREVAKERFGAYRAAVREQGRAIDRRIASGYAAIARGHAVILLSETIQAGGLDEHGRPKLAVCRADAQRCALKASENSVTFVALRSGEDRWSVASDRGGALTERRVRVPFPGAKWSRTDNVEAIVPIIPPEHRPRTRKGGRLLRIFEYHLLWEASWQPSPRPRDPALIRHIGGDLWAVVAVWNLTELEAAVLVQG